MWLNYPNNPTGATATKEQLMGLPYMESHIADAILDWRDGDANHLAVVRRRDTEICLEQAGAAA